MPTFYRTRTVRITDRSIRVFDPTPAVYLIEELGPVWAVTPDAPRVLLRVSCSSGAMVVAVLMSTQQPNHAMGWVVAALVLSMSAILLTRRPRLADHSLVTTCRGEWVCLYATRDPVEFGQVRRALQRALEWHDNASV
jgi:hypothetical protein